jgi:hypothetical protein
MRDKPVWLVRVLWFYSAWFRYGGLAFALLSALFLVMMGISIVSDWSTTAAGFEWRPLAVALCPPLIGVTLGLALYKLVPRVSLPKKP